jgi:hypothetical protein
LGQQISLIDQTIEDARQKLRDIVLVAYDSLDPTLKRELPITRSNTGELAVRFVRHEEAKTNAMFAGLAPHRLTRSENRDLHGAKKNLGLPGPDDKDLANRREV